LLNSLAAGTLPFAMPPGVVGPELNSLAAGILTLTSASGALMAPEDIEVDIVEVGIPYSDPLMDGPVIAYAADQALKRGVHVADAFSATRAVRDAGAPPLVMSYWNLILRHGPTTFARDLAAAGGAGIITPDLIPDEGAEWIAASDETGLDRVFLVAPSSTVDHATADGGGIPIEERDPAEVTARFPARNPAFDVTPAALIAAIVTEHDVHSAPYEASLAVAVVTV